MQDLVSAPTAVTVVPVQGRGDLLEGEAGCVVGTVGAAAA